MSDFLSGILPYWLGGTSGGVPASVATDTALSSLGSGQYGPETAQQYTAAGGTMPSTTGGNQMGGDLQKALQGVNQAANQQSQQKSIGAPQLGQGARSEAGRPSGGQQSLAQLLQLLNARTNMYMGNTNPQSAQPQAQTQRQTGLLGF